MSMTDELERLHKLHQSGALSSEEFARAKSSLLTDRATAGPESSHGYGSPGVPPMPMPLDPVQMERDTRLWAFFVHISLLAGLAPFPLLGYVVPVLLWQLKKNELPDLDAHGKVVVNWMLSSLIYWLVAAVLCLALVGFALLAVLFVLSIVFPIIGAVKANNGEVWKYPLSIQFLK